MIKSSSIHPLNNTHHRSNEFLVDLWIGLVMCVVSWLVQNLLNGLHPGWSGASLLQFVKAD